MIDLIKSCEAFSRNSLEVVDFNDQYSVKGKFFDGISESLSALCENALKYSIEKYLSIQLNGSEIHFKDIDSIIEEEGIDIWNINLNKRFYEDSSLNLPYLLFMTLEGFEKWLENLDPFSPKNSLHKAGIKKIFVHNLPRGFGCESLAIESSIENANEKVETLLLKGSLPDDTKVKEQVHIIGDSVIISPELFAINYNIHGNKYALKFLDLSLQTLSACLVQEFYNSEKVVLKGYRKLYLPLINEKKKLDDKISFFEELYEVVAWAYTERTETKLNLLADRLSLDISKDGESLVTGLQKYVQEAYNQAKDQYKFVILEKKDEYINELRNLTKETQELFKSYSSNIRGLVNSLVRDVLAAILLVAFGIFSKSDQTRIDELIDNANVRLVFRGLAIYFLAVFIIQLVINFREIDISKQEIRKWFNDIRNYMTKTEIEKEINNSLAKRDRFIFRTYLGIGLIYICLILFCWYIQDVYKFLIS